MRSPFATCIPVLCAVCEIFRIFGDFEGFNGSIFDRFSIAGLNFRMEPIGDQMRPKFLCPGKEKLKISAIQRTLLPYSKKGFFSSRRQWFSIPKRHTKYSDTCRLSIENHRLRLEKKPFLLKDNTHVYVGNVPGSTVNSKKTRWRTDQMTLFDKNCPA